MLNKIWQKIAEADAITIFRHVSPDMDAIGSQFGLKAALLQVFPEKTVKALGTQTRPGFQLDTAEDEEIADSLAILLDTANEARIDDGRFKLAKDTIRLDHHVKVEELAGLDYVDEKASATGEVLTRLFRENGISIPKEAAQHLYEALTADNIRFTTGNTTPESLRAAAWLLEQGADVIEAELHNYARTMADLVMESKIQQNSRLKGRFLFSVLARNDYLREGMAFHEAKEKVHALNGIKDAEIWALFTQKPDADLYNASLRSRTIPIRDVAVQYGGGGHGCASGIKDLTGSQVQEIIGILTERSR